MTTRKKLRDYLDRFRGKQVAVVGAGISNRPLIEILLATDIETTVRDKCSRKELGEAADQFQDRGAKLRLGDDYLDDLCEDIIFRTPGLMPTNPALSQAAARGAMLTSEMEAFFDICPCKIIGITGSDGKTTTTSIVAELLSNEGKTVYTGGNIGTPLLYKADEMNPDDVAVVELSSFQLITMHKCPDVAIVTNLAPNHLDIHSNMEEYIIAKSNIFKYQKQTDRVVFNLDNEITREYAGSAPANEVLFFSRLNKVKNGVYLENGTIYESNNDNKEAIMQAGDVLLPGVHNIENYLAAFAAVMGNVSHETMRKTAESFQGVEHRIELVRELRGVRFYNDSIASSPSRAIAGLKAFTECDGKNVHENERRRIVLIAGGKDKGVAFDEFGVEIAGRVKTLVLTGMASKQILNAVVNAPGYTLRDRTDRLDIIQCEDFEKAVLLASEQATQGDIVLLSPACTSFDKFKNFEERGKTFKDIVNRLV